MPDYPKKLVQMRRPSIYRESRRRRAGYFGLAGLPHFHAIALFRIEDYAAAAIPTVPGRKGPASTRKYMIGSVLALTTSALTLTFTGYTGYRYLAVSALMGLCWLCMAWSGRKVRDDRLWARRLFRFSILYLFVLSFMMSIDLVVPASGIRLACAP